MTHRIAVAAVRLVLAAFLGVALAFALAVRGPGDRAGAPPPTHRAFDGGTCATCHGR
jgi:mono/diheme cytochrome c family protein